MESKEAKHMVAYHNILEELHERLGDFIEIDHVVTLYLGTAFETFEDPHEAERFVSQELATWSLENFFETFDRVSPMSEDERNRFISDLREKRKQRIADALC